MQYDPSQPIGPARKGRASPSFVIGQIGQTLDGRVATPTGKSLYINGECALEHLHRLRAGVDAVIVGVGTIIADDPRLTVRLCEGASPVRVVIDPDARMPADAQCLTDGVVETLVIHREGVEGGAGDILRMPSSTGDALAPEAILATLRARGLKRILVEGGPTTLSRFIECGAIDELHVMVAPKIFGSGREGIVLPPIDALDEALNPLTRTLLFEDGDVLFRCDLTAQAARSAP